MIDLYLGIRQKRLEEFRIHSCFSPKCFWRFTISELHFSNLRASPHGRQAALGSRLGLGPSHPLTGEPGTTCCATQDRQPVTLAGPAAPGAAARKLLLLPGDLVWESARLGSERGGADVGRWGDSGRWPGPPRSEFQGWLPGTPAPQEGRPRQAAGGTFEARVVALAGIPPIRVHGPACLPAVWFGPNYGLTLNGETSCTFIPCILMTSWNQHSKIEVFNALQTWLGPSKYTSLKRALQNATPYWKWRRHSKSSI